MSEQFWTVERVKEELPHVRVIFPDGTITTGRVTGRLGEFAAVKVEIHGAWVGVGGWAWESVATVLNEGRKLIL
jgi:hypothetical protein